MTVDYHQGACTGSGHGMIRLDRDLQILEVDRTAAAIIGRGRTDAVGVEIEGLIGFSLELRTLKTHLAMAAAIEPLDWLLEIDGRAFHAEASVARIDAALPDRTIVLRLSATNGPASTSSSFLRHGRPTGRGLVTAVCLLLPLVFSLGLWLVSSPGESRAVDSGSTAGLEPGMTEPSPSSPPGEASLRRFVGQVHPGTGVAGIAPLDGHIAKLEAPDFGIFVNEGDLLVTLDPGEETAKQLREARIAVIKASTELLKLRNWSASSDMRDAERSVEDAEREVRRARLERDRTRQLFDDGIVAGNEHEAAEESLRSAESHWESAIARREEVAQQGTGEFLEIAEEQLEIAETEYQALERSQSQREVRAPIAGIMLPAPSTQLRSSDLSIGQEVKKGTSLFLIGDLDEIIVQTSVSEFDIDLIEIGQKATVTTPAQPAFEAIGEVVSISQISSSFGDLSGSMGGGYTPPPSRYDVAVKIVTADQKIDGKIRIGMTVDVEINTAAAVVASQ